MVKSIYVVLLLSIRTNILNLLGDFNTMMYEVKDIIVIKAFYEERYRINMKLK